MYIEIYTVNGESIRLDDDAKINNISIHELSKVDLKNLFNEKCIELTKYDLTYFINTNQVNWFLVSEGIH
ncbi:hypothetical protein OJ258_002121 [Listeria monocytogenes]|uniref:lmo0673 family protein n=1 Tax=Listeria monocytogenes TaxID=1639 RepID=UPI00087470E9|nr:hypothetical protein [Listeria monocytogenes]EHC5295192.1 hypothetical protein [Listeria monocytogenes serotype 1/2a]EAA0404148.1 hypothetical protein [Listeria monocytogenes]EAC8234590.1 hypothetical protein [Listeria monocytogenes]EAD1632660.1 hypothetical protein [Listeria monocytogenes]EAD2920438.1 hypothetical protein [Listeria monocytogenes]